MAIIVSCDYQTSTQQSQMPVEVPDTLLAEVPAPNLLFGFPVDSFIVTKNRVRWSQNISDILTSFNIDHQQIYELASKARGVYDVRKFKAGYEYTIIHENDSLKTARQMFFEPDERSYVVFNLLDSIYVKYVEKESQFVEREIAAVIERNSSVYDKILEAGASPALVSKLVDIFAWQVDFFRIQAGDRFKVIYEEEQVDGNPVAINSIKGAYFEHFDKKYYAVNYSKNELGDYFDEEGNSLRKTFLRAPLNYSRISSRYTPKRFHPVLKRYKAHLGTDYAARPGTPVRTVGDGVILEARYGKYNGNFVKVKHNSNYTTQYLHLSKIAKGIRAGMQVKQGQTIGYVGSTGLATGPHLCFRFWKNGRQVDALKVDLPPSKPIDASELLDFLHTKNIVVDQLERIEWHPQQRDAILASVAQGAAVGASSK